MIDLLIALCVMLGSTGAMLLFIWFNTPAFVEYMRAFGLSKFLYVGEYLDITENDPALAYHTFLASNYPSFLTRLLNCPKCLGVWIGITITSPVYYLTGSILFYLFCVPTVIYSSLSMYGLLCKLMKHE